MAGRDFQPDVTRLSDGTIGVGCSCGWVQSLGRSTVPLLDVLNAIGEHNSKAHLTTDNQRLKTRGR